jgi:hypothetical protein
MTKNSAELEMLMLDLRDNISKIRRFVRKHNLPTPPELELLEKAKKNREETPEGGRLPRG